MLDGPDRSTGSRGVPKTCRGHAPQCVATEILSAWLLMLPVTRRCTTHPIRLGQAAEPAHTVSCEVSAESRSALRSSHARSLGRSSSSTRPARPGTTTHLAIGVQAQVAPCTISAERRKRENFARRLGGHRELLLAARACIALLSSPSRDRGLTTRTHCARMRLTVQHAATCSLADGSRNPTCAALPMPRACPALDTQCRELALRSTHARLFAPAQ